MFSRTLFLDGEVKAAGDFSLATVAGLVNVPAESILSSGIDFADVGGSQAQRVIGAMREQYTAGKWRNALQLAIAAGHIENLVGVADLANRFDLSGDRVTISDKHIGETLRGEYSTDVLFLTMCALKKGIVDLKADGRAVAASHGEDWLAMLESGLMIDKFTPEVTTADVLAYPSYLNPRPDKGMPSIRLHTRDALGDGSRNHTIRYPNGDRYRVDFPFRSQRRIKGRQEDGYDDNKDGGMFSEWPDLAEVVDSILDDAAVEEIMQRGFVFKDLGVAYSKILREAVIVASGQPDTVKTKVAAAFAIGQQLELVETDPSMAAEMYNFSVRGWGSKKDTEDQTGVSLTWEHGGIVGLSKEESALYKQFGDSLNKYALARLAEQYAGHPELADKIARKRAKDGADDEAVTYMRKMILAASRLCNDRQVQEVLLANRLRQNQCLPRENRGKYWIL